MTMEEVKIDRRKEKRLAKRQMAETFALREKTNFSGWRIFWKEEINRRRARGENVWLMRRIFNLCQ